MFSKFHRSIWTMSISQNSNIKSKANSSLNDILGWNMVPKLAVQRGEQSLESRKSVKSVNGMYGINKILPSLTSEPIKNELLKYAKRYPALNVSSHHSLPPSIHSFIHPSILNPFFHILFNPSILPCIIQYIIQSILHTFFHQLFNPQKQ